MAKKDTLTLRVLIERSRLLTEDRKEKLLEQVSSVSPVAQKKLENILNGEDKFLSSIADHTIAQVISNGDTEVLKQLDDFFAKTGKTLRKTEKGVERAQETEAMKHLLDDINT